LLLAHCVSCFHPRRKADQDRSLTGKPGKLPAARPLRSLRRTFRKR
jgi:hypothetical protein